MSTARRVYLLVCLVADIEETISPTALATIADWVAQQTAAR